MAQLKDTTIDGALTVNGAATFEDAATTRQNLNYIGANPVTLDTDTPATWKALGTGIAYINANGVINSQPNTYGFIENRVHGDIISQTWHSMNGYSDVLVRSGNADGWYSGSAEWVRVVDKNFVYKSIWDGSCTTGGTMSDIPDLMNYRLYAIYMSGHATVILGVRYGETYIRGIGGYSNSTPTNFSYHFGGEIGSDKTSIKYIGCNYLYHVGGGSHGDNNTGLTVTEICGII